MVYAIGLAARYGGFGRRGGGRGPGGPPGGMRRPSGGPGQDIQKPDQGLPKIAAETGGGYFELTSTNNLSATFTRVVDELHHQYVLAFSPAKFDGKAHKLELRIKDPTLTARARKTYVARGE